MSQRLVLRPEAEIDVAEAAEWYDQQRAGLSLQFRAALDKTFRPGITGGDRYPAPMMARLGL